MVFNNDGAIPPIMGGAWFNPSNTLTAFQNNVYANILHKTNHGDLSCYAWCLFQTSILMKKLLSLCLIAATALVTPSWAAESPAPLAATSNVVSGEVLEIKEVESYSYLRLKTKDGETWAAVSKVPLKKGDKVTIENVMVMNNFESKSLKKSFSTIVFGTLAGAGKAASAAPSGLVKSMAVGPISVPKASGANARTVAEVFAKSTELKDKPVRVSGKIVKYNAGIMGKNWIHLRDGTGVEADGTHDILVTTVAPAKLGDVVTVSGNVRTNKDFGAGYTYKVLIEEASLQP
jgi:hypothetical protein